MKLSARLVAFAVALAIGASGTAERRAAGAPDDRAAAPSDYEVKAAFLFHFAKFVEWPEAAIPPDVFVVGILGSDPLAAILEETLEGKTVLGRGIVLRRLAQPEEAEGCQILFIGQTEERRLPQVLKAMADKPTLTVGDTEGYAERGVMVNFRVVKRRVRFEINLRSAEQAHLKISSQLLKLAMLVDPA